MAEPAQRAPGHTDVAALCGAAIAVPLAIFRRMARRWAVSCSGAAQRDF